MKNAFCQSVNKSIPERDFNLRPTAAHMERRFRSRLTLNVGRSLVCPGVRLQKAE